MDLSSAIEEQTYIVGQRRSCRLGDAQPAFASELALVLDDQPSALGHVVSNQKFQRIDVERAVCNPKVSAPIRGVDLAGNVDVRAAFNNHLGPVPALGVRIPTRVGSAVAGRARYGRRAAIDLQRSSLNLQAALQGIHPREHQRSGAVFHGARGFGDVGQRLFAGLDSVRIGHERHAAAKCDRKAGCQFDHLFEF